MAFFLDCQVNDGAHCGFSALGCLGVEGDDAELGFCGAVFLGSPGHGHKAYGDELLVVDTIGLAAGQDEVLAVIIADGHDESSIAGELVEQRLGYLRCYSGADDGIKGCCI